MGWTDERVELLRKFWAEGLSGSQIAKQLGHITRNAVIAKAWRLGLQGRDKASKPSRVTRVPHNPPWIPRAPKPRLLPPQDVDPSRVIIDRFEEAGSATILTIGPQQCRWPIGDPLAVDFTLCGKPSGERVYCPPHHKLSVDPKPPPSIKQALASARYLSRIA